MKFIILIALAALAGYGILQADHLLPDNYVKMYVANYVIELKIVPFILLLIVLVVVLYFVLWLVRLLMRSPTRLSRWFGRRARNKADEQLGAGYLSLIKGDWRKAESLLTANSNHSHIPYVNFLVAAVAAQEQGKLEQRDKYLQAAYNAAPKERLAIGLTKAKLHERAGQVDEALSTLNDIRELGAKNPQYTAMMLQVHQLENNWAAIQQLLPTAKKQSAISSEAIEQLYDRVYTAQLAEASDKQVAFKALPRAQKSKPKNVAVLARELVSSGETAKAEKLLRSTLKSQFSDELVNIYGLLPAEKPQKLLRQIEGWLLARPESAELNLAAGRMAKKSKDFEKAKQYLQSSIAAGHLPEAYAELGDVFELSNESGKALQLFRAGMQALSDQRSPKKEPDQNAAAKAIAGETASKQATDEATQALLVPNPK